MPKTKSTKAIRDEAETTYKWVQKFRKLLIGRTITSVRYMTPEEANESLWDYQPICIGLDDGTTLIPVSDDEMNQAGSIFHHNAEESTIPVMRERS